MARALSPTLLTALLSLHALVSRVPAQELSSYDKQRGRMMLDQVKSDIKDNYYDPSFHGVDLDAAFKAAEEKLKNAKSNGQIMGIIAQTLVALNDSHTFFLPPSRKAAVDYGWEMQLFGDSALVTRVKEKSDAEAKGLKVGDAVLSVDGYLPARANLWQLLYLYYALRPQPGMHLTVQSPGGAPREFDVLAKVEDRRSLDLSSFSNMFDMVREGEKAERERKRSHRRQELGDALVWKMPRFNLTPDEVNAHMGEASKHKALILDLRGNSGGAEDTMLSLLGNLFERELKVGDIRRRKEVKPLVAKSRGEEAFKGQLVVLVDSRSASAAELLARVVQIEKRGKVVGDRTAGAVMRSRSYSHEVGLNGIAFYGTSVTDADIVMADGKRLEGAGVTPDEVLFPTGADLAAGRDPALARAAALVGVTLFPEKAGALFPEPKKN
ncbi:MAG: hypothetical protein LC785_16385 [Acidobacteria bacterium]|nr:hypothetical protein [Acidobacteriota bacterium]